MFVALARAMSAIEYGRFASAFSVAMFLALTLLRTLAQSLKPTLGVLSTTVETCQRADWVFYLAQCQRCQTQSGGPAFHLPFEKHARG